MKLEILGTPKAKQSAKFARVGKFVKAYQPKDVVNYEAVIRIQAQNQLPEGFVMFDEPVIALWVFIFPPLKGFKKPQKALIESGALIPKSTKPDVTDNLPKPVADSLNGIIYSDDHLVVMSAGIKCFGLKPRTVIFIEPVGGMSFTEILYEWINLIAKADEL